MSRDAQTLSVYDGRAADYLSFVDKADKTTHLSDFIAALSAGDRVLDLGCGPGHCAAAMQRAGLVVDATDASREMVRLAGQHPGINVVRAGFDDLDADNVYNGIWASFSLLHAPKSALPAHLAAIYRALLPGGVFTLGMKLGSGEARDALGRFYAYYSANELDQQLIRAGLNPAHHRHGQASGLVGGKEEAFIVITAHA